MGENMKRLLIVISICIAPSVHLAGMAQRSAASAIQGLEQLTGQTKNALFVGAARAVYNLYSAYSNAKSEREKAKIAQEMRENLRVLKNQIEVIGQRVEFLYNERLERAQRRAGIMQRHVQFPQEADTQEAPATKKDIDTVVERIVALQSSFDALLQSNADEVNSHAQSVEQWGKKLREFQQEIEQGNNKLSRMLQGRMCPVRCALL